MSLSRLSVRSARGIGFKFMVLALVRSGNCAETIQEDTTYEDRIDDGVPESTIVSTSGIH